MGVGHTNTAGIRKETERTASHVTDSGLGLKSVSEAPWYFPKNIDQVAHRLPGNCRKWLKAGIAKCLGLCLKHELKATEK